MMNPAAAVVVPAPKVPIEDAVLYKRIARKMYMKMPVPVGVTRAPFEQLDENATNLWMLLARAAVEALNEVDV